MNKEKETIETKTKPVFKNIKIKSSHILILIMLIFSGIWIYFQYNVTFEVKNSGLIAAVTISIMLNVIILAAVFATGIGQKVFKRFLNRIKYKKGNYVNSIYISKNGVVKEIFKKVDDETGCFNIRKSKYIRNPLLLLNFEKIPTYIHREGNPDPLNIWQSDLANDMSNAEMDIAMSSAYNFDLKQFIEKYKLFVIFGAIIIIGIAAASTYLGYMVYQMLRDGTYTQTAQVITTTTKTLLNATGV